MRWLALLGLFATPCWSNEAGIEFFEKEIRPVLLAECAQCHSPENKVKGGLRLDWRGGWAEGGNSGEPVVIPGKPEESLLIAAIRRADPDFSMPPKKALPKETVRKFERWVEMGAPDPRVHETPTAQDAALNLEAARQYWAFQPLDAPPIPPLVQEDWPHNDVDRFALAKMEANGTPPVSDASATTLLRRLTFDLVGLPPTPEEIERFNSQYRANPKKAIDSKIDSLLASPHFGERWARHWLDVARYSESTGGGRTLLMKEAWRYRDYVINAFNADKPYDEFVRQQIAGDLLRTDDNLKTQRENLIATAFLLLGPTNYELQDKEILEMDIVDEQLDTLGKAFLGLTMGCARCHDHKFDPITTEDYYGMAGILKGTKVVVHNNVSTWNKRPLPMDAKTEARAKRQAERIAALKKEIDTLKKAVGKAAPPTGKAIETIPGIVIDNDNAEFNGSWSSSDSVKNFVGADYVYANGDNGSATATYATDIPKAGRYEVRLSFAHHPNRSSRTRVTVTSDGQKTIRLIDQRKEPAVDGYFESLGVYAWSEGETAVVQISNQDANGAVVADAVQWLPENGPTIAQPQERASKEDEGPSAELLAKKARLEAAEKELTSLEADAIDIPQIIAADEGENPQDIPIAVRGNVHHVGDVTPRRFIKVLHRGETPQIPDGASGRVELANWLASPDNPLTARVLVNRVWAHLFGQGIVTSPNNFGQMGRLPSHPKLLDYLAVQFIEDNWSIKQLIRNITRSRLYQLSSDPGSGAQASIDPANKLLWRQNRRRLEAEAIRDSILAVSGRLERQIGGPMIKPGTTIEYGYDFDDSRRSIYTPIFRNTPREILAVFDFADPNLVVGKRTTSSVATQALYLMNNEFVREQSQAAAARVLEDPFPSETDRITYAYQLALGRPPSEDESHIVQSFLNESPDAQSAWTQVMHSLYASIEFRYVN